MPESKNGINTDVRMNNNEQSDFKNTIYLRFLTLNHIFLRFFVTIFQTSSMQMHSDVRMTSTSEYTESEAIQAHIDAIDADVRPR